jgi:hypothetical protein
MAIDLEKLRERFPNGANKEELKQAGIADSEIEELEKLQVRQLINKVNGMNLDVAKKQKATESVNKNEQSRHD